MTRSPWGIEEIQYTERMGFERLHGAIYKSASSEETRVNGLTVADERKAVVLTNRRPLWALALD